MSVSVRSGPAAVIGSGSATVFWSNDLVFGVDYGGIPFTVTMGFVSDPAVGVEVRTSWPGGGLRFDLVNFDGADGRGSAAPVLITEVGEELIFLHFRVFRYGMTPDRTVHWTFYAAPKAEVTWPVVGPEQGG